MARFEVLAAALMGSLAAAKRRRMSSGTASIDVTATTSDFDPTADGVTTATVTATVTRNAAAAQGRTLTVAVERTFVSASLSTLSTAPSTILDSGADTSYSTITILDTAGRPLPGIPAANCVMAVSGSGNTVTQPVGVTDFAGRITGSFVSTVAATKTVSWTILGLAITDTDHVTVTSTTPVEHPNEPAGLTEIGSWDNETTVAGSLVLDGSPYISVTNAELGTLVFDGANNISASNGATPWAGAGITAGMMAKLTGTASNDTYYALTGVTAGTPGIYTIIGDDATTRTTNTAETDSAYTLVSGWGDKTRVTSGYTGMPTYGGAAVVRTFMPGGVHGGHDAGRLQISCAGTETELYAMVEVQFPSDYPVSTSSGGNKHLIITFSGGSRFFINFDEGAALGHLGIYIGSSPLEDSTTDYVLGAWTFWEIYLRKPSGSDNDGILRLYADGVNILTRTNLSVAGGTFPAGNFSLVYWDGSNNGNHTADHPVGQRYIGVDGGTENQDAVHYMALLYASGA